MTTLGEGNTHVTIDVTAETATNIIHQRTLLLKRKKCTDACQERGRSRQKGIFERKRRRFKMTLC